MFRLQNYYLFSFSLYIFPLGANTALLHRINGNVKYYLGFYNLTHHFVIVYMHLYRHLVNEQRKEGGAYFATPPFTG